MDVDYMTGRRYAPHFDLLYLAALRVGVEMATLVGNASDAADWEARYALGHGFVNNDLQLTYNATTKSWDVSAEPGCSCLVISPLYIPLHKVVTDAMRFNLAICRQAVFGLGRRIQ